MQQKLAGFSTALIVALVFTSSAAVGQTPFHGSWAFELPDGGPAWLKVFDGENDQLTGLFLLSVGRPRPVKDIAVNKEGILSFEWKRKWRPFGQADQTMTVTGPFEGRIVTVNTPGARALELKFLQHPDGKPSQKDWLTLVGKKLPPHPPKPDLAAVTFGPPRSLIAENSLKGWMLSNPKKKNGWRVEGTTLINETPKTDFSAYGEFGNLITEEEFNDFRLSIEYNVPKDGNSGIYLRGMYEAQVVDRDSRMQGISGPGAIFGRIEPSQNAGKVGGQWNRYVLTLVNRHIQVELNGKTVIPLTRLEGCTGGGISADDSAPGPIFLQGDHTSVKYRNIVIEPVVASE